jgi:hypothetical protein
MRRDDPRTVLCAPVLPLVRLAACVSPVSIRSEAWWRPSRGDLRAVGGGYRGAPEGIRSERCLRHRVVVGTRHPKP